MAATNIIDSKSKKSCDGHDNDDPSLLLSLPLSDPPPPPCPPTNSNAASAAVLTGKVIHRMHLFSSWINVNATDSQNHHNHDGCKKRKRSENNDSNNSNINNHHDEIHTQQQQQLNGKKTEKEEDNKNVTGIDGDDNNDLFSGWIFQCSSSSSNAHRLQHTQKQQQQQQEPAGHDHHHHHQEEEKEEVEIEEYILSVPARWTSEIAMAVSHSYTVHIQHYQILPVLVVPRSSSSSSTSSSTAAAAAAAANANSSSMNGSTPRFQHQQQRRLLLQISDQENAIHVDTTTTTTTTTIDTACNNNNNNSIHNNSMDKQQQQQQQQHDDDNNLWTLRQLARLEAVDWGIKQAIKNQKATTTSTTTTTTMHQQKHQQEEQQFYSLSRLVIEAISPVICLNNNDNKDADPFCLLQVHDDDDDDGQSSCRRHACIVVLKGNKQQQGHTTNTSPTTCPLSMLPALWPGHVIESICNVRPAMRWKIPEVLEILYGSSRCCGYCMKNVVVVPQRVFVVKSSRQIVLDHNNNTVASLPPRPLSLSSSSSSSTFIRGRILKVCWIYLDYKSNNNNSATQQHRHHQQQQQQQQHLNYILLQPLVDDTNEQEGDNNIDDDIEHPDNDDDDIYDLVFLTYFPMDTCLQYSLRVGAIVQATNLETLLFVHHHHGQHDQQQQQPRRVLAASIRSTVTLVRPSSCLPTMQEDGNNQQRITMGNGSMIHNPYQKKAPKEKSTMMMMMTTATTALPYAGLPNAFVPTKKGRSQHHFYLESFCRFKAKLWCQQNSDDLLLHAFNSNGRRCKQTSFLEDNLTHALLVRANNGAGTISNASNNNQNKKTSNKHNNNNNNHARNPYAEFFNYCQASNQQQEQDYVPEEEDGEVEWTSREDCCSGCCIGAKSAAFVVLPSLVSLDQLHAACMRMAKKRLFNELQQRQQRHDGFFRGLFSSGWTGSFVLAPDDLSSIQPESILDLGSAAREEPSVHDETPALWTGGVTLHLDKSEVMMNMPTRHGHHCLFDLSNGHVTLPIHLPACAADSSSKFLDSIQERSFVYIEVQSVVVSCVCLGKVPALDNTIMKYPRLDNVRVTHLPSFHDSDNRDDHSRSTGKNNNDGALGPCSLVEVQGHLFVVSVYLCAIGGGSLLSAAPPAGEPPVVAQKQGNAAATTNELAAPSSKNIMTKITVSSIRACLDPAIDEEDKSSQYIVGLMVRKFFKLTKPRSGLYNGCMLTLSHTPINHRHGSLDNKLHYPCSLQSIDVKTSVKVDESKRLIVRRGFERLFSSASSNSSTIVSDDQITLAMVWWQLACSTQTCALLSGGWDELPSSCSSSAAAHKLVTVVQIPRSAAHIEPRRGYVRFRCTMQGVSARVLFLDTGTSQEQMLPARRSLQKSSMSNFDFTASDCFFPGMLEGRCRRVGNIPWGLLAAAPNMQQSGIPTCTLADMHWSICADLRNATRINMAPSMVRQVCGATFLGISYCRALAECTKCFKALHDPYSHASNNSQGNNSNKDGKKPHNGVLVATTVSAQQQSFWHLPLPMPKGDNNLDASVNNSNTASGRPTVGDSNSPMRSPVVKSNKTHLQCPNNCNVNLHAAIKWECSGTLDDGTGQAVLYAERTVALTLLGIMNPKTVQQIEQGAFLEPGGIIYKKVLPPSPQLRAAIEKARAWAHNAAAFRGQHDQQQQQQQHGQQQQQPCGRRRPCRLQEDDVLQFLTPAHRAEYLLQRHCRAGPSQQQSSSHYFGNKSCCCYLVRCKPLSDEVSSLNHTEITTAAPGGYNQSAAIRKVSTYALPPLKLNLVDMAISNNSMDMAIMATGSGSSSSIYDNDGNDEEDVDA